MKHDSIRWEVSNILGLIGSKRIVLQPDYQRLYIWPKAKEQAFIDTLLRGFPIPPIWVWQHPGKDGRTIYEVIDGQQRLTCIQKFVNNEFEYKQPHLLSERETDLSAYNDCFYEKAPSGKSKKAVLPPMLRNKVSDYSVPVMVVETDDRDLVIDIFKRLNKSATNLTPQELRNAFYVGEFKTAAYDLAAKLQEDRFWGGSQAVFRRPSTDRMRNQQFVSDLLVLLIEQKNQEKSEKLDYYYQLYDHHFPKKKEVLNRFDKAIKTIKKLIPAESRLTKNQADFYSLFFLVDQLLKDGLLSSQENIASAKDALRLFELEYNAYDSKRAVSNSERNPLFEEYRETIVGRQRERETRERRYEILDEIVRPGLRKGDRDNRREFSESQKLLIWQLDKKKICKMCGRQVSSYADYEPDHVIPWSKGGRTEVSNGQVTHATCNRFKGGRSSPAKEKDRKKTTARRKRA